MNGLRLGGDDAAGVAADIRKLVPPPESVRDGVALIIATVRAGGDRAVRDYSRTLDTGGREPRALAVSDDELEAAVAALDPAVRHGIERAIENVEAVAATRDPGGVGGVGGVGGAQVTQLGDNRVIHRHAAVERAAIYVPGGRAPYPSTVVMGAVPARLAGVGRIAVCSPPREDGDLDPVVLAACRLAGVHAVYRMGGAHAIAALAYGTKSVPAVDVIVGPGNLYVQEAKRQVFGQVGIDGFAGPSDLLVVATGDVDPEPLALDLLAQAEHGPGTLVVAASDAPDVLDAFEERLTEGADTGAIACLVASAGPEHLLALAQAFAPEHLQLVGARGRGAGRSRHPGRVRVRRRRRRHRVRRLHRRLQSHPAHERRRSLRLRRLARALPAPLQRGPHRGAGGARARGGAAGAGRGLRVARAVDGGTHKERIDGGAWRRRLWGEWEPMTRIGLIERKTAETEIKVSLALDGHGAGERDTGVGFFDHMLDLLARHGRLDLGVEARGDLETGAHHTVEDVGICIGQALDEALGDRSGIARYGQATIPMDEARASCAIDVSGRGLCAFEAALPPGAIGNFDHELVEEFFRALALNAKLTLHLTVERGTNAHHVIEASFKAAARALRAAVALDASELGVPSTKGTLT